MADDGAPAAGAKQPLPPLSLCPAERRALLPEDGDYAGASAPLDEASLLAGLRGLPIPLAFSRIYVSHCFALLARNSGARLAASVLSWYLMLVPLLVFNARLGAFGTKQIAAASVAITVFFLAVFWLGALGVWTSHKFVAAVPSLDANPFAQLVRWRDLLSDKGSQVLPLVRHDPADRLCPCGDCSSVVRSSWIMYPIDAAMQSAVLLGGHALSVWTLCVTFAPLMWSTWWSILLFAVYAALLLLHTLPSHFTFSYNTPSVRILGLSGRLQHRAMVVLLSDMVDRHRRAAAEDLVPVAAADEPYVELHFRLAESWPSQLAYISQGRAQFLGALSTLIVGLLLNAVAAGCVPLWMPLIFLDVLAIYFTSLLAIAAANLRIEDVAALYRRTRADVLVLRSRRPSDRVERSLADHDALLALFAQTEGARQKYMGFTVDAAVVRTLAVTCVTLSFGLWTVLRAAGVYFTVETVCAG
ncbi:hypothetical protein DFJ74DRAFT_713943 [Hyaloraphidium curvatum]|nr:hypothetical protein DFJ74DRAFT_713943 [Hyaloraphidium curvatum]